ncbi:putative mRNA cleavage and polyadenylation factor CLP1 P loop [Trypanosoma vivax]|uniref:Clp1 P-loop domain-containing protein n=1 Tax=Trypanosoma vivax (strain Y486) TaxID=1055687 RepID=G0UCJ6_TRYVY|nr:hypothetical protein TRVL_03887 [Trypanosoma vivax]KAH8608034.1 putative mRNA cleavage and polyadenylation factor CLP1 P loop [Trypanosoma vivax]CCC53556.1 conserved hypothetical protein [Trypanosoma vivax Y486]
MSFPHQRRVTISAGEECTISGNCAVELQLQSGVVEVAGVPLNARESFTFHLLIDKRSLIFYTLEGGSVLVIADGPYEMSSTATTVAPVVQLCYRSIVSKPRSKVLVVGSAHCGKTLIAHTICNLLREGAARGELGEGTSVSPFLMDLNMQSNCLYSPGCVSAVQVEQRLWPGLSSSPTLLPISLFVGEADLPSSNNVTAYLHFVAQLQDCTEALLETVGTGTVHLIIDAPAPAPDIKEGVYFRRLVELLRPTHVVTVTSQDVSETWPSFLEEDVQRLLPECEVVHTTPVARRCSGSLRDQYICEYFAGTPHWPLGCAKVVLPLNQLTFVQYVTREGEVSCQRVQMTAEMGRSICALSHAEIIEEVPFAPVAGMLLLLSVDEEHEEVVAVVPACEPLPRRFLILPNNEQTSHAGPTLCSGGAISCIEKAVSV